MNFIKTACVCVCVCVCVSYPDLQTAASNGTTIDIIVVRLKLKTALFSCERRRGQRSRIGVEHTWAVAGPRAEHHWVEHTWAVAGPRGGHHWVEHTGTVAGPRGGHHWVEHTWAVARPGQGAGITG